jgi:hypothetical protein
VPFSIELEGDYEGLLTELGRLIADAKDVLESDAFSNRFAANNAPIGVLATTGGSRWVAQGLGWRVDDRDGGALLVDPRAAGAVLGERCAQCLGGPNLPPAASPQHRPQRPMLLAVDQELAEGATLPVAPVRADPVGPSTREDAAAEYFTDKEPGRALGTHRQTKLRAPRPIIGGWPIEKSASRRMRLLRG